MGSEASVPAEELRRHRESVQAELRSEAMDGFLVTHPADRFYLDGVLSSAPWYLPAEGAPVTVEDGPGSDMERLAGRIQGACGLPSLLGAALDVLPMQEIPAVRRAFPRSVLRDGSPALLRARSVKTAWELERMSDLAERTCRVFEHARGVLEPGLTEIAFSGLMQERAGALGIGTRVRVRDHRTEGYPWHVLSGESGGTVGVLDAPASGEGSSPAFPCGAGYRRLALGEPVMVDFAVEMGGYHMDETRMLAMGPLPREVEEACRKAVEIHDRVVDAVSPGETPDALFLLSLDAARELGCEDAYLGPPGNQVRFVGHGIGVELIEPPLIAAGRTEPLKPGMTFALEPKLVYEGRFAAGVESVVTVTGSGHRLISRVPLGVLYG